MDKVQKIREEVARLCNAGLHNSTISKKDVLNTILAVVKDFKEEPISEELEVVAKKYGTKKHPMTTIGANESACDFKAGAEWQKEQFENNRLAHCDALTEEQAQMESDFVTQHLKEDNRTPTFIDAIEYGMKLQKKKDQSTIELAEDHAMLAGMEKMKEQMMKDAVDMVVGYWMPNGLSLNVDETENIYNIDEGDRVKMLIIKDE